MKKATYNISIQSIVVIILAITILGFGLMFIRELFRVLPEQNETTEEEQILLDNINKLAGINQQFVLSQIELLESVRGTGTPEENGIINDLLNSYYEQLKIVGYMINQTK